MDRTANLLGALALLLTDELASTTHEAAGRGGAAAAALAVLGQDPGLGIEALRGPLGLTHSAAVRLVDTLEADGCARRARGADGRSVSVTLTPTGEGRARAVLQQRADVLDRALAALTESERAVLAPLLERVLAGLVSDRAHADRVCRLCDYATCPEADCPVGLAGEAGSVAEPTS